MPQSSTRDIQAFLRERVIPQGGGRHGLVVGIERYRDARLNLRCARRDAEAIFGLMTDGACGMFPKEEVRLLLDEEATRENVWRALSALRRSAGENDSVWIYYAGHAAVEQSQPYWVTHDADVDDLYGTGLSSAQIGEVLGDIRSRQLLVLLDCCHAAATAAQKNPTRAALTAEDAFAAYRGKGRLTLSSSDGKEKSVELSEVGHGAFTYFLDKGLRGEADKDGDGVVTADELWEYLRGKVAEASRRVGNAQTPMLFGEMTHDVALTVNPSAYQRKQKIAESIAARVGLGEDRLTTEEAAFCLEVLRRGPKAPVEEDLLVEFEALAEGRVRMRTFKYVIQAARRNASAEAGAPGTDGAGAGRTEIRHPHAHPLPARPADAGIAAEAGDSPVRRGVERLYRFIRRAYGPRGRAVLLPAAKGSAPFATKNGPALLARFPAGEPGEDAAAHLLREAALRTFEATGEGALTTVVLGSELFFEGRKAIQSGSKAGPLARGMERAVQAVSEALERMNQPVKSKLEIERIAGKAAGNDVEAGRIVAEALDRSGKDDTVYVRESSGVETRIETVNGIRFDRGYLSGQFVTDAAAGTAVLDNAYVLVYDRKIATAEEIEPLIGKLAQTVRSLLIVAEDVEGEALDRLVSLRTTGALKVAAVKAPGFGDRRKEILADLAILTDGKPLFLQSSYTLATADLPDLGRARRIVIDRDSTAILEGAGSPHAVQGRIDDLRRRRETTPSNYDREKIDERLAALSNGVTVICVGGAAPAEIGEKKERISAGLRAAQGARVEGLVPGGGYALYRSRLALNALEAEGEEDIGIGVVRKSLKAPLYDLLANAGADPEPILEKIENRETTFGYDLEAGTFGDLNRAGIMDTTRGTRIALMNGFSAARLLLDQEVPVARHRPASDLGSRISDLGAKGSQKAAGPASAPAASTPPQIRNPKSEIRNAEEEVQIHRISPPKTPISNPSWPRQRHSPSVSTGGPPDPPSPPSPPPSGSRPSR